MKHKIKSLFLALFVLSFVCLPLFAGSVLAQGDSITDNLAAARGDLPAGELVPTVGNIIKIFVVLLSIVLVIYLLWAGYTWLTAEGEPDKVKKAKEMIRNGIIGIIIVLMSYAIADFVITNLIVASN